jgi:hypothetical protein
MRNFATKKNIALNPNITKFIGGQPVRWKKSCWKGVHAKFSKFGPLLLGSMDNGQKGIMHQIKNET